MKRYERAVIRRPSRTSSTRSAERRGRVVADRGFADVALFTLLSELGGAFVIAR